MIGEEWAGRFDKTVLIYQQQSYKPDLSIELGMENPQKNPLFCFAITGYPKKIGDKNGGQQHPSNFRSLKAHLVEIKMCVI